MYGAGHEVVSVLAFTGRLVDLMSFFSRPSNRKQPWKYLVRLFKDSNSIQYNLYFIRISDR